MPSKGSDRSREKNEAGARRMPAKAPTKRPVPTTESKNESGPRRLYAPAGSPRSTSTRESGPRRLYSSPAVTSRRSAGRGTVKPTQ